MTSVTRYHVLAAACLTVMAVGCTDPNDPLACTAEFVYGIAIEVTDSVTAGPVVDGLAGVVEDGAFTEPMTVLADNILLGAGERAGTYTATVEATGYESWTTTGIVVTADQCHVTTVELDARLQPL